MYLIIIGGFDSILHTDTTKKRVARRFRDVLIWREAEPSKEDK
jgi:hypothetical protein